ncbi:MAG: hypothetical protein P8M25_04820 [Paracoccaceae bacterium]|nr:hypothetical protein [Paracoccaceae bacterium]
MTKPKNSQPSARDTTVWAQAEDSTTASNRENQTANIFLEISKNLPIEVDSNVPAHSHDKAEYNAYLEL